MRVNRFYDIIAGLRAWQIVSLTVIASVALTSAAILFLGPLLIDEVTPDILLIGVVCSTAVPLLLSPLVIHLTVKSANLYRKNVVLERAIREKEEAQHGKELLLKAIEGVPVGVTLADRKGRIIYTNPAEARIHGYEVNELMGRNANIFAPQDRQHAFTEERISDFSFWSRDVVNVRKDKSMVPVHLSSDVVRDPSGEPTHIIHISEDITERKLSEARLKESLIEKETLLKEVHHRVKNNLMIVSSLLSLQLGSVENEGLKTLLEDSRNRIRAMSLVHEILYQNENLSRIDLDYYIRTLLDNLARTSRLKEKQIRVRAKVEIDTLDMDTLIPCGLIINELVSNAFKHAFDGLDEGAIDVDFIRDGRQITLSVSDTGIGIPRELDIKNSGTLGMKLVNALVSQLEGELSMESNDGTVFTIVFTDKS